jgi:D-psicose/D-tagatose/L-ribulose 3-epimerase
LFRTTLSVEKGQKPERQTRMKLGVNTLIWSAIYDDSVEAELAAIKEHGFDGIEFPLFRPTDVSPARIRRAMEENGLECNAVGVFMDGLSILNEDASIRSRSVQRLKDLVAITAECGADTLAGPLYCPVGYLPGRRRTADEWSRAIDAYQQLGGTLVQHKVTLAIEPLNRFETFFLNTAEDAALLAEQVAHPNIGILYDTFHANIEEKNIAAGLLKIGKHLKLIHTCENDRGTPGSGHVEWDSLFAAIRQLGYDGWLTIESFGFALPELCAAAAIWRDIESSPSAIAYEGVRFLRQAIGADRRAS